MSRFKRILVIADLPEAPAEHALEHALKLGASEYIDLVTFIHDPWTEDRDLMTENEATSVRQRLLDEREQRLRDQVAEFDTGELDIRCQAVWQKDITDWVANACDKVAYDVVVKTGHRSEALGHTPVDWQLLRRAPAPIYIAEPNAWRPSPAILATVDVASRKDERQDLNHAVMKHARALADALGSELHVTAVAQVSTLMMDLEIFTEGEYRERFLKSHGDDLDTLVKLFEVPEDNVHVTVGQPAKRIPKTARDIHAEVVVMGTVGRKGLAGRLLGSTAENVLGVLRTSVLVVPPWAEI